MDKKTFYTKFEIILNHQLRILERINSEEDMAYFSQYFGERENFTGALTKLLNLYIKLLEFQQKFPEVSSPSHAEEVSPLDWEIIKDKLQRRASSE